jgi:membrane-bound lytic murein transglycosylase
VRIAALALTLVVLASCSSDEEAAPPPPPSTTTTTTPQQLAASACRAHSAKDFDTARRQAQQAAAGDPAWEALHQSFEVIADFQARTANEESDANNAELLIRGPAAGEALRRVKVECERAGVSVSPV